MPYGPDLAFNNAGVEIVGPRNGVTGKNSHHRDENRSVSKIVRAQKGRMRLNVKEQIRSAHWECDGTAVFGGDDFPIHQGLVGHFGQALWLGTRSGITDSRRYRGHVDFCQRSPKK